MGSFRVTSFFAEVDIFCMKLKIVLIRFDLGSIDVNLHLQTIQLRRINATFFDILCRQLRVRIGR